MLQQNYTAPELPVRVSRKERFSQAFEMYQADGITPSNSLSGWVFSGELLDRSGQKVLMLTTNNGISHPATHAVLVELTTAQMNLLRADQYRLEIYGTQAGEREYLVNILMTVE